MFNKIVEKIKLRKLGCVAYARDMGVCIGERCNFVSLPDFGSEPYLIEIGDHTEICSDVTFITHDGATWVFRDNPKYKDVIRYGKIKIGNNCFIGKGTTILPNVTIGDNTIIGASSLVTKDIPSGEVWGGVPAKKISTTELFAEKCLLETPQYDFENYKKDKQRELLKILSQKD